MYEYVRLTIISIKIHINRLNVYETICLKCTKNVGSTYVFVKVIN